MTLLEQIQKEHAAAFTHGGKFHADDVFSAALLLHFNPQLTIQRGNRVPEDFDGIVFDIGRGEYDHHQKDSRIRENQVPYAAFGLLWEALGTEILSPEMAARFDEKFVQPLDLNDNTGEKNELASMIGMFNPVWDDNSGSDAAFLEAVAVAGRILEHKWERFRADERAEQQFAALLAEHRKRIAAEKKAGTMDEKILAYLKKMPDQMYAPLTDAEYETIASAIPSEVEQNYKLYKESLKKPMPFYIGVPTIEGNTLKFNWDASYDFNAEDITYTVELAKDYQFKEVVYRQENLSIPEAQTTVPADGQYFLRVRATNASGKTQDAFDYYVTDDGKNYGMKCFYITGGTNVEEDIYVE